MIQIGIFEFLKTGEFGNVKLGMSREEVLAILGEPRAWYNDKGRDLMRAHVWEYEWVSFYFTPAHIEYLNEGLYMISMSRFYGIHGIEVTPHYTLDTWALSHEQDVDFVEQRLIDAGLTFTKHNHLDTAVKWVVLQLESGVELSFHENYDEETPKQFYFTSIKSSRPTKMKHATKQVSITIPRVLYDKVRRMSQQHSESISAICSELLIPVLSRLPDAEDM
jgi:hypothetical protein